MERENFAVRTFRGARSALGMLRPIYSDTSYGNRDPANHIHGKYLPFLDPTRDLRHFDDFYNYIAGDWTVTKIDGDSDGNDSEVLLDGDGGWLKILTTDKASDSVYLQKVGLPFLYVAGKPMGFACRFKVDDATLGDFVIGLQATNATPLTVVDGITFQKGHANTHIDLHVVKDSTATDKLDIAELVADTFISLEWVYDGEGAIHYSVNGVEKGTVVLTNVPDDVQMGFNFGVATSTAATRQMTVDYIMAWKLR